MTSLSMRLRRCIRSLASRTPRRATLPALVAVALLPTANAGAATKVFGSSLSLPATLNTAENLSYPGVNTLVPVSPEAPNGVFHTFHFGADTALWNLAKHAIAPEAGQILKIRLEGCARPSPGGPPPLREVHFQALSPFAGGGATVNLTSQGFEMPVCGEGANSSTVSTYEPTNLCVNRGDYVDFNDEGGYVENIYRNGVPYDVLGSVRGATTDSFIRNNGTGDGANLEASYVGAMEGFASNANEELMMQMELGTGADARYVCPGGSKDAPPVLPEIRISPQTDGINRSRIVEIAVYCRPAGGCPGTATLTVPGRGRRARAVGATQFDLPGGTTAHVAVRVSSRVLKLIHREGGVATTMVAVVGGQTFSQTVVIKIL
jgi:hypothetical protein